MYLNEDQLKAIKSLSDRIDLATKFRTYSEKFSAENYQDPMLQNFFCPYFKDFCSKLECLLD